MASLSPAEVLGCQKRVLGEKAGALYNGISNDIGRVRVKWREYCLLFRSSPEQFSIMNRVAPFFFYSVQHLMFDDIVLHLARITGPARSNNRQNLTVAALPNALPCGVRLSELVSDAVRDCHFTRDSRNRALAHRDLELFTNSMAVQVQPVKYNEIDKALRSLWNIIVFVEAEYFKAGMFDEVTYAPTGVESLLYWLKQIKDLPQD